MDRRRDIEDFNVRSAMPRRELRYPHQIVQWLEEWGRRLCDPGEMILIGSGALLWHVARSGRDDPLPESSMDVDPITDSEAIAELAYDAMIGSEFELQHGWHVNLMMPAVLREFPADWESRSSRLTYGLLTVVVPAISDLLEAKARRNEPRDRRHAEYIAALGLG
jgi:Nucleotidyltransferase of unknown function (DUF6036)